VNQSQVSSTALSEGEGARLEELPQPPKGGSTGPAARPAGQAASRPSGWTAGRVTALVIGALLGLFSLGLLGAGGTALWANWTQRDGGYITTDVHEFSTAGSALTTVPTYLGSAGIGWLYAPGLLGQVRIRVTPSSGSAPFLGIGPTADVDRYLGGVSHTVITDIWTNKVQVLGGGTPASAPGTQHFWVATATGPGPRTLKWDPVNGSWTVVVMNADGRPGIDVRADLGARIPALLWIAVGFLVAGGVFGAGGALLIAGAIRRRRSAPVGSV
jgi:hypothetical protein